MRPYIVRHLLGIGAATVVVVTLCAGWPVYNGVAQVDPAADDAILTVGQCIEANASVGPLEEVLIKEDMIEEDLLQTKVTNGMCKDIFERSTDGTAVRKLLAAQNYIQEIQLIEGAMRKAADEVAARGTDRYSSSDESLVRFQAVAQTSEQLPVQSQYDGTGGDGTGGVEPSKRQAAAAASVGVDPAASIPEIVRLKEAALKKAGASTPEARAGAHCGTEVEVSDDKLKRIEGLYEIRPQIPEEMRLRETEQAGLLVSPVTRKRFEEIRQKHGEIDEVSESGIGCVELVDRMKAQLVLLDLDGLGIYRRHPDDIRELSSNQDTIWSWEIFARQTGNVELLVDLRYAISREGQEEFRLVPQSPVYEEAIRVTPRQSGPSEEAKEQPWWRRFFSNFEGILQRIFGVSGP